MAHSHYDGVRAWPYPDSDWASTLACLRRLRGRPQFISHEGSTRATRAYLTEASVARTCTSADLPYRSHTDRWVLRDIPERRRLREWVASALGAADQDGKRTEKRHGPIRQRPILRRAIDHAQGESIWICRTTC